MKSGRARVQSPMIESKRLAREPTGQSLRLAQNLYQRMRVTSVVGQHLVQGLVLEPHADLITRRQFMAIPVCWSTRLAG